jgi:hypothetical protein
MRLRSRKGQTIEYLVIFTAVVVGIMMFAHTKRIRVIKRDPITQRITGISFYQSPLYSAIINPTRDISRDLPGNVPRADTVDLYQTRTAASTPIPGGWPNSLSLRIRHDSRYKFCWPVWSNSCLDSQSCACPGVNLDTIYGNWFTPYDDGYYSSFNGDWAWRLMTTEECLGLRATQDSCRQREENWYDDVQAFTNRNCDLADNNNPGNYSCNFVTCNEDPNRNLRYDDDFGYPVNCTPGSANCLYRFWWKRCTYGQMLADLSNADTCDRNATTEFKCAPTDNKTCLDYSIITSEPVPFGGANARDGYGVNSNIISRDVTCRPFAL